MKLLTFTCLLAFFNTSFSQQKVNYYAEDKVKITADLYLKDYKFPFILMFHQSSSSRGEYTQIARKLFNLKYNCLVVDLRAGGKENFIANETNLYAKKNNIKISELDARKDILASINYVKKMSKKAVVLFGSGYSASLCLLEAQNKDKISAVVAFSPGEYFFPHLSVKESVSSFNVPLFLASDESESKFVREMTGKIPSNRITFVEYKVNAEHYGAKALWQESENNEKMWLELLLFFKKINEI